MTKSSIKTTDLKTYQDKTLPELEEIIRDLEAKHAQATKARLIAPATAARTSSPAAASSTHTPQLTAKTLATSLATARHALRLRQRAVKAQVMDFERENHHNLLFFCSTQGFVKLAGHSALFFAMTIAERINWRYSLKPDTDHYSPSTDGIISFRSLENVQERLATINIYPNPSLSTTEFFYFDLSKSYSDEQIAKLRDNAQQDMQRIMSIVLPTSPIPGLYDAISQASHLLYYQFKHLADNFAKEMFGEKLLMQAYELSTTYLYFAQSDQPLAARLQYLTDIIALSKALRNSIAFVSKLEILHHRETCDILTYLVAAERIAGKAHQRLAERATKSHPSKATAPRTVKSKTTASSTTTSKANLPPHHAAHSDQAQLWQSTTATVPPRRRSTSVKEDK